MPAWMTSEFRLLIPVPIAPSVSNTSTSRPDSARARAVARPTTPAPMTTQSTCSVVAIDPADTALPEQKFAGVKPFGPTGFTARFDSPDSHQASERVRSKPPLRMLRPVTIPENRYFSLHLRAGKRHIGRRRAQVSLVLGNFVFEYQVIAECIPGQFRYHAVILVQIGTVMAEDQIWVWLLLQGLKHFLDRCILRRKKTVAKTVHNHLGSVRATQEAPGAGPKLPLPLRIRTKHDPGDIGIVPLQQPETRTTAADINVIAMCADGNDPQPLSTRAPFAEFDGSHAQGPLFHTIQGQVPRASSRSKVILSLNVSMHCQNPCHGNVSSFFSCTSRANGCSTSSSPSRM